MDHQPKPDSKKFSVLISDIERGVVKVPKFQRDFVWDIEQTAKLLDSILKGYPIGTFILWETDIFMMITMPLHEHSQNQMMCDNSTCTLGRED